MIHRYMGPPTQDFFLDHQDAFSDSLSLAQCQMDVV